MYDNILLFKNYHPKSYTENMKIPRNLSHVAAGLAIAPLLVLTTNAASIYWDGDQTGGDGILLNSNNGGDPPSLNAIIGQAYPRFNTQSDGNGTIVAPSAVAATDDLLTDYRQ